VPYAYISLLMEAAVIVWEAVLVEVPPGSAFEGQMVVVNDTAEQMVLGVAEETVRGMAEKIVQGTAEEIVQDDGSA
jgi:hypothetical protein